MITQTKLREIAAALIACECNLGGYRIELMSWAYQLLLDILERKRGDGLTPVEKYKLARMCTIAASVSDLIEEPRRSRRYTTYAELLSEELSSAEHNALWPQLAAHMDDCARKISSIEQNYTKAHVEGLDE